jgi:putative cardiolipin synthase
LFKRAQQLIWAIAIGLGVGTSVSFADPTLFLANPKTAASVRLGLAQDAKQEVMIASYVFKMDRVGLMTLAMLRNAAKQGKRAVLLLDAFGSELPVHMLSYLTAEGVEIYQYHPFNWKNPFAYFRRHHLKIFVVDGKHLVAGDRNSGNEYFGLEDHPFLSRDVYVSGKAAQDAKAHVEELIRSGEVTRYTAKGVAPALYLENKQLLDREESTHLMRRLSKDKSWTEQVFESDSVEFFHDPVGKKGSAPGVDQKVIDAIDRARFRITLENPYIDLPDPLRDAFQRAADRGVEIQVLTNSLESTNSKLVGIAWERSRNFFASIGATVWELPGLAELKEPRTRNREAVKRFRKIRAFIQSLAKARMSFGTLHAKTMVIDDADSYIKSYNLDARSEKLNMEEIIHIKGEKFASQLSAEIEKDMNDAGFRLVAAGGKLLLPENAKRASCFQRVIAKILKDQL